jgi:hypothetical protein
MYNNKTNKFTKLNSKIQKQFDKIQGKKNLSLKEKRDECNLLFLEYGIFGDDVYELRNKNHMTSWHLRRNKVLAYYGDILATQQQETTRRQRRELRRIGKNIQLLKILEGRVNAWKC